MKILHAPLNLANDGFALVQGLRGLGQDAHLATIESSVLTEKGDIDLSFGTDSSLLRQYKKWQFCQHELLTYDVIHYHFGRSILDYGQGLFSLLDFKSAARRNVPLFMTFHGCDVRNLQPGGCPDICFERVCEKHDNHKRIEFIKAHVDKCYVTTPDLLPAIPEAKLASQCVWGIEEAQPQPPSVTGSLKVAHAPTSRARKGTSLIVQACEQLISEGLDIELTVIEHCPHVQALELMRQADIVVDQLVLQWYGVVSVEAASFGKVIVTQIDSSYIERFGLDAPPFISVTPDTLAEELRVLYTHRTLLPELGERCRDFVLKHHGIKKCAQAMLADYGSAIASRGGKRKKGRAA
jgi:glycosyltransferase involved in cell wall biosynthesis